METKYQVGDIVRDPINDNYYLIEELKPHSLGVYYGWRMLGYDDIGYFESVLIDKYGEFNKVG